MKNDRLIYMALGGAGEIGMNAYLYGYGKPGKERFILVDIGVAFPDMERAPGVELILPDLAWLFARIDQLEAVFITHAHEDHIGALGYYAMRLGVPVFCQPFTAGIARRKCEEQGADVKLIQTVSDPTKPIEAGPFSLRFFPVSHSIPEAAGLVIDTPVGRVVHTGDFKLDKAPVMGSAFTPKAWEEIAKSGIKALVCDSTNIFSLHPGRSESSVLPALCAQVAEAKGLVVATTFASNVARLKSLAQAGEKAGRSICFLGRAMNRMIAAASEAGFTSDFPKTITPEEAAALPRSALMLIVTGSQGEGRAASAQLSRGRFKGLELKKGDLFLFSSKTIPGNEKAVIHILNNLSRLGVRVVGEENDEIHVSGHANRPDLERIHKILKPECVIPMHGEHRHLSAHAELAVQNGAKSLVATNGMMIDLTGKKPKLVDQIETVPNYLDGNHLIGAMDGVVRARLRMARDGIVGVNLVVDTAGGDHDFWIESLGLMSDSADFDAQIEDALERFLRKAKADILRDEKALKKQVHRIVQDSVQKAIGKKPQILIFMAQFE